MTIVVCGEPETVTICIAAAVLLKVNVTVNPFTVAVTVNVPTIALAVNIGAVATPPEAVVIVTVVKPPANVPLAPLPPALMV